MGNKGSLPKGEMIDAEMIELSKIVASESFKENQRKFFAEHCEMFDDEEENKLEYTEIHKQYEVMVEGQIKEEMGEEKLNRIEMGIKDYIAGNSKTSKSVEVYEAVEVLASLGDFENFKQVMLAAKAGELPGSGMNVNQKLDFKVDINDFMDKLETLNQDANTEEGWEQLMDNELGVCYSRKTDSGDTLLRTTMQIDVAPEHALECFVNTEQESLTWRTDYKSVEILEQTSPDNKLVKFKMSLPWAFQYIFAVPEYLTFRIVLRRNWPQPNQFAYVFVPFDPEKGEVEELGSIKISAGTIVPNPQDPNKCIITNLDKADMKYIPKFVVKKVIKSKAMGEINKMFTGYKKSQTYANLQQQQQQQQ